MSLAHTRRGKHDVVAVLDIGSTKTVCFIAEIDGGGKPHVVGMGHQLSKGVRSGVVVDLAEVETSVMAAIHGAEKMAGRTIEQVLVNISAGGIASQMATVELTLAGGEVTEQDVVDLVREGQRSAHGAEHTLLHSFVTRYFLDAARSVKDPRHMIGQRLGADMHLVVAPNTLVQNRTHCLAHCHMHIEDFVVSAHASALAVLQPDEMDLGATVMDLGGGVSSVAVFGGGKNVFMDYVPVGGMHVTNDLAQGLSTTLAGAERLKTLHGSASSSPQDEHVMIDVPQFGSDDDTDDDAPLVPRSMLVGIIRPRMEEIFELLRDTLESSGMLGRCGRHVVLTGGGSQMPGVRELATRMLGKQVRIAKPRPLPGLADAVSGPAFATAIGMVQHALQPSMEVQLLARAHKHGFLRQLWQRMLARA